MISVKRKDFFLLLSVFITVIAFMVANEKEVPFVSNIVYGKVNAVKYGFNKVCGLPIELEPLNKRAFKMIKGDLKLNPGERGFNELSDFLMEDLKRFQPKYAQRNRGDTRRNPN